MSGENKKTFSYTVVTDKKIIEVNKKTFDFIKSLEDNITSVLKKRP